MKKILIFLSFSCLSLLSFAQDNSYSDEKIIEIFSQTGAIHNKGLEVLLENLKAAYGDSYQGGLTADDRDRMFKTVDGFLVSYATNELSVQDIDLSQFINRTVDPRDLLGKDLVTRIQMYKEGQSLSNELLTALNELNSLIDDDIRCFDKAYYDELVQNHIRNLSSYQEKADLVACTSIAYSSMTYWEGHLTEWQNFFTKNMAALKKANPRLLISMAGLITMLKTGNPGKNVAKSDVTGAISGIAIGSIVGAAGGTLILPGIGTITGWAGGGLAGALIGGLGSSVNAAVTAFLNWLF